MFGRKDETHWSCRRTATSIATRPDPRNPVVRFPTGPALFGNASNGCQSRAYAGPTTPTPQPPPPTALVCISVTQIPEHRSAATAAPIADASRVIADALDRYQADDNLGALFDAMRALAARHDVDALVRAAEPFRDRLEVVIPLYEHVIAQRPNDARALVTLANAYWLTGRGPEIVGQLAQRARAADPTNRAAWHLWALAEPSVRARMERWQRVSEEFPADQLARAALADNAASLAGAEHDPLALDLAIATYDGLLREAETPTQRRALEETLTTLRGWRL